MFVVTRDYPNRPDLLTDVYGVFSSLEKARESTEWRMQGYKGTWFTNDRWEGTDGHNNVVIRIHQFGRV
jgi:hypothetical protein